jgi:tetratricopeptide (TPR) repeat protein
MTRSSIKPARRASRIDAKNGSLRDATALPPAWAVAVVLTASIVMVYYGSCRTPFIFDDEDTVEKNSSIRHVWPLVGNNERPGPLSPPPELPTTGRPLVNLTFATNYRVGELNPFGYHVVNMALHCLTALLVWAVVRRTLRLPYFAGRFEASAGWLAMAVALLWALHPLQTEAVVYVTQRTELMMAFFYLATFYCAERYWAELSLTSREGKSLAASEVHSSHRSGPVWLVLAVVACSAGMASKEVMVSAPLMVLLFERTFITGSFKEALRRSWPLYAGLAATWLLLLLINLGAPRGDTAGFSLGVSAYDWWLTQAKVLLMYLKLAIWPSPLLLHYEFPYFTTLAEAWIYVVPVLLLAVVVCVLLWRNNSIGFLGTLMFAILSPTLIVPIVTEMAAERRMYLPLLVLVILFVVGGYSLAQWAQKRWGVIGFARVAVTTSTLILVFAFGVFSAKRLGAYNDEMALWREVLQNQPNNYMAHNNLGRLLMHRGQLPEAINELQLSVAANPNRYFAFNNLGVALYRSGRYAEAIEPLNRALQLNPDCADALQNLGNSLRQLGRLPEAKEKLDHALRLRPDDAEVQNNMGVLLESSNQVPQAIERFRLATRLDPKYAPAHINLGKTLATTGDDQEAIRELGQAIELEPNRADLHNDLGIVLGKNQQNDAAIEHFQIAVKLDPRFAQAYSNLALTLALINRPAEAIATSQRGIAVARSTGQMDVAKLSEEWLTHYQEELSRGGHPAK